MTARSVKTHGSGSLPSGEGTLLAARGLPPDLAREAAKRLELLGLAIGFGYGLALVLTSSIQALGWHAFPHPAVHASICAVMIVVSAGLAWLSRNGRVGPRRLLVIGLVYEVVVAFAISMGDNLGPLSADGPLVAVSWLCVWIVMFPVLVPARPARSLLAGLAAASTWPAAYLFGLHYLGNPPAPDRVAYLNFLENYIAAGAALGPLFIMRRLAAHLQRARAMGSYELVGRLSSGGMGEVWQARHRLLARPAAIKLIRPDVLGLEGSRVADRLARRFEREAQATAALHSPHTIELYDFGITSDGTFYYVMELLEGLDLDSLVSRFGPVPAERVVYLLLQACDSLADAHHAGLIHRDIKPANICACRKGLKHDFVKVLDFGLVKSAWREDEEDTERLTLEGVVAGTPAYMAPEIVRGSRTIDARVDIYALGCVAYWLLTGETVFPKATPMQMALHHAHTPPVPPSTRTELAVPPALERIILRCLEKAPERRPSSAEELGSELAACPAETPWTESRAKRWWETHLPGPVNAAGGSPTSTWPSSPSP